MIGGNFGDILRAGTGADTLQGGIGNDSLEGGGGSDALDGGSETDTVSYQNSGVGVTVSLSLGANPQVSAGDADGDTLTGIENLTGSAFADRLLGDGNNNVLNGLGGDDDLTGFFGDDTYVVDGAGDRVTEVAGGGTDRVLAAESYALGVGQEIEVLSASDVAGTSDLDLIGNNLANTLIGNAGANVLSGGGGDDQLTGLAGEDFLIGGGGADRLDGGADADVMRGGEGDDTYYVENAGDLVFEASGSGSDTIVSRGSYVLQAGLSIEALRANSVTSTTALDLTGNELAQSLRGNAGANRLDGGGDADSMHGFGGDDTYYVDNAGDVVIEAANGGNDAIAARASYTLATGQSVETLRAISAAGTANLNLTGNNLGQAVIGNAGDNVVDGKGGLDTLRGYGGSDTFSFSTTLGAGNVDHIADFSVPADTIQLDRTIFTQLSLDALSAAAFKDIGVSGATVDGSDRILYDRTTGQLFYDADGSGATERIEFAVLDNRPTTLSSADFFVVA